jgi:hypothetical protein
MKSKEWQTYRTRFLVKARRLSSNLTFIDGLGRQHSGREGDYLVESSEGVISIAPRQIFEDIYVAMGMEDHLLEDGLREENSRSESSVLSRKLPQPCRAGSTPGALGLG